MNDRASIETYWLAFLQSLPADGPRPSAYTAWTFGDSAVMADELGELVGSGRKTGTSSLLWAYEIEGERLPQVGEFNVILDGQGRPLCVTETLEVVVQPFSAVSAEFAAAEGEGDQTLDYWRRVHWEFFGRQCRELHLSPTEPMPVVCERFKLRYRRSTT